MPVVPVSVGAAWKTNWLPLVPMSLLVPTKSTVAPAPRVKLALFSRVVPPDVCVRLIVELPLNSDTAPMFCSDRPLALLM